jgi:hypothetical protein
MGVAVSYRKMGIWMRRSVSMLTGVRRPLDFLGTLLLHRARGGGV